MIDDRVNRTARRVAIHQAVDEVVDARRQVFGDETAYALRNALLHLSTVAHAVAHDKHSVAVEGAWRVIAAIAQGQLEQAMEARAS